MTFISLFLSFLLTNQISADLLPQMHHRSSVPPMTLDQVEAEAMENNPEIRAISSQVDTALKQLDGSMAFDDPSLMYRGWGVPIAQPWNVNQAQHMFMFSQDVPGAGKRGLRYLIAASGVDIVKLEVEARKRQILSRVRQAFFDLQRTYDELQLHDTQIELARQTIAAARIKYTVGRTPQQDVLKAQVALSRLVEHLVLFERGGDVARVRLNTLMGRNPLTPLEVHGTYVVLDSLPASVELQELAMENRPELLVMSALIRQAETKARLAAKAYSPDLSIGAGYMLMPGGSPSRNADMGECSMTLPGLNRGKHDAEIQEARSEVEALRSEYQNRIAQALQQIEETRLQALSAKRLVDLYKDTLHPQSQMTLRSASAAYQVDQTDFLDVLDSQNMTLEIDYAYFRALGEYEARLAELEEAVGVPLPRERRLQ